MSKKIIKLTEKDLEGIIEKVISEQPTPSQQIVAGVRKESAKVNTDYYKAVGKKMDTFQKSNNKSDTIESKDLKKVNADQGMGEEKKDVIQDYNYALQNLRYDTQPSKAYKERQEMAIKGDSKMGNGETEATEMTEDLKDPKLGEKIIDAAKARYKAETESPYNKTVSMGDDIETTKESPNKERQLAFENIVSDIKEKLLAEGIELSDEDIAVSLKEEIAGYGFGFKKEAEEVTEEVVEETEEETIEETDEVTEEVVEETDEIVAEEEIEEEDTVEEGSRTLGNGKSHGRKGLSKPRSAPSHIAVDESFDRMKELMGIKSSKPIIKEEVSNDMPCPICHGFPCECKEEEAEGTLAVSLKEDIAGLGYGFKQENDSTIEEETMEAILSEEACPDCGKEVCDCGINEETTEEVSEEVVDELNEGGPSIDWSDECRKGNEWVDAGGQEQLWFDSLFHAVEGMGTDEYTIFSVLDEMIAANFKIAKFDNAIQCLLNSPVDLGVPSKQRSSVDMGSFIYEDFEKGHDEELKLIEDKLSKLGYTNPEFMYAKQKNETMDAILSEKACPDCGKEICDCGINENKKYKRLKYSTEFESTDQALTLIPEHHKVDGNMFQLTDNNNYITVRWEGNKENGEGVILLHKNNKLMNESMDRMKKLMGHSFGDKDHKKDNLTEAQSFQKIMDITRGKKTLNEQPAGYGYGFKSEQSEVVNEILKLKPENLTLSPFVGDQLHDDVITKLYGLIGKNESSKIGDIFRGLHSIDTLDCANLDDKLSSIKDKYTTDQVVDYQEKLSKATDVKTYIGCEDKESHPFVDGDLGSATLKTLAKFLYAYYEYFIKVKRKGKDVANDLFSNIEGGGSGETVPSDYTHDVGVDGTVQR